MLPREAAERIGARVLDGAMVDLNLTNKSVGIACELHEKSIRNARLGAQSLPFHALFQVDADLREALIHGVERECDRIYQKRAATDIRTALITCAERGLEFGLAITRAQRRLLTGRALSQDIRESLTGSWSALVRAGDDMVFALSSGDR